MEHRGRISDYKLMWIFKIDSGIICHAKYELMHPQMAKAAGNNHFPYLKCCTISTLCWRASDQPTRSRRPTRHSSGRGAVLKQDGEQFERRYHLRDLADVLAIAWSIPGLTGHIISVRWLKSWTWSVQIAKFNIFFLVFPERDWWSWCYDNSEVACLFLILHLVGIQQNGCRKNPRPPLKVPSKSLIWPMTQTHVDIGSTIRHKQPS